MVRQSRKQFSGENKTMSHDRSRGYMSIGLFLLGIALVLLFIGLFLGIDLRSRPHGPGEGSDSSPPITRQNNDTEEGRSPPGLQARQDLARVGGMAGHNFIPPVVACLPFCLILGVIAVFPLLPKVRRWWERNANRALVSALLGAPVALYVSLNDVHQLIHTGLEYFQFVSLLGGLFIVSGGLHLTGNLEARPSVNTAFLSVGYVLASVIGTTGAAMVLIYPVLRTNLERRYKAHTVIFFIFLVCNLGGALSPVGDPPLFLGYLKGIDFFWFLRLFPMWIANGVVLLTLYWFLERHYFKKETPASHRLDIEHEEPIHIIGLPNILLLIAIVAGVAFTLATPYREAVVFACAGLSLIYTDRSEKAARARARNGFTFHAIVEVMVVFAGIFMTMIPALILLNRRGGELGVDTPLEFFFATGLFSSFLDNAPTFLCFLELGLGVKGLATAHAMQAAAPIILGAISSGAVFFGAMTYIGNAPNFMVRSIAESRGVKMPSFFGYMIWALVILLPVLALIGWLFLKLFVFPMF